MSKSDEITRQQAVASVQSIFERYNLITKSQNASHFDTKVMADVVLLDASVGPPSASLPSHPVAPPCVVSTATCALKVSEDYGNVNGVMHGGAVAVVFDMLTSLALAPISKPGYWTFLAGVSRALNVGYLKAIPIGTTIHIHGHVYQVGKTMAYIKGYMTSEDGKTVYAVCDHHKVQVPSKKEHLDHRISWDEQWEKAKEPKDAKL